MVIEAPRSQEEAVLITAAVQAADADAAKRHLLMTHDTRIDDVCWLTCEEKPRDWRPYNAQFRFHTGMVWHNLSGALFREQWKEQVEHRAFPAGVHWLVRRGVVIMEFTILTDTSADNIVDAILLKIESLKGDLDTLRLVKAGTVIISRDRSKSVYIRHDITFRDSGDTVATPPLFS